VQGGVAIEASIAATGRVADARVVKSMPLLDNAALDAVRQWQFAQRADGGVLRRVIRVVFVLNNPDRYPRPAEYTSPLPSWIPANFAWTYKVQCRGEAVEIDSIARTVSARRTPADAVNTFQFDAAEAADVFVMLVAGGFFDPETSQQTWKEQPEVKAGVQEGDNEIAVTVAVTPPPEAYNLYFPQPGADGMRKHSLSVRRNDTWREASWTEPVGKDSAPTVAAMSALGRRLREFVRTKVTDARQVPDC
jgi:TonB family protein